MKTIYKGVALAVLVAAAAMMQAHSPAYAPVKAAVAAPVTFSAFGKDAVAVVLKDGTEALGLAITCTNGAKLYTYADAKGNNGLVYNHEQFPRSASDGIHHEFLSDHLDRIEMFEVGNGEMAVVIGKGPMLSCTWGN